MIILILNIPSHGYDCLDSLLKVPILRITERYMENPSIMLIKAKNNSHVFKFSQINIQEVKNLKSWFQKNNRGSMISNQSTQTKYILPCKVYMWWYRDSVRFSKFRNKLKQADIKLIHENCPHYYRIERICLSYRCIETKAAICQIEKKALKLLTHIVSGKIYFMISQKDPYSTLCYSMYVYVN